MKKMIDKILGLFCISVMIIMTVLVTWQVFTRYVLNDPSVVTGQLSQYLFVWLVLYGAAYVFGKREHMAIVFLQDKLNVQSKKLLLLFQEIVISLFVLGVFIYGGYISSVKQMMQVDAALQIPIGVIYSAIPISGLIIIFYTITNMIKIIKGDKSWI